MEAKQAECEQSKLAEAKEFLKCIQMTSKADDSLFASINHFSNVDSCIATQFDNCEVELQVLEFFTKELEMQVLQGSLACKPYKNFHSTQIKLNEQYERQNADLFHPMPQNQLPFTDQVIQFYNVLQENENARVQIVIYLKTLNQLASQQSQVIVDNIISSDINCLDYFRKQSEGDVAKQDSQTREDIAKLDLNKQSATWGPKKLVLFGLIYCLRPLLLTILYSFKVTDPISMHLFQSCLINEKSVLRTKQYSETPLFIDPISQEQKNFDGNFLLGEILKGIKNFLLLDDQFKPDTSSSLYQFILEFLIIVPQIITQYKQVFQLKNDSYPIIQIQSDIDSILEQTKILTQFSVSNFMSPDILDEEQVISIIPGQLKIKMQDVFTMVQDFKKGEFQPLKQFFQNVLNSYIQQGQKSIVNAFSYNFDLRSNLDEKEPVFLDRYLEETIMKQYSQSNHLCTFYLIQSFLPTFQPFSLRYLLSFFDFVQYIFSDDIYNLTQNNKSITQSRLAVAITLKNDQVSDAEVSVQQQLINFIEDTQVELKQSNKDVSSKILKNIFYDFVEIVESQAQLSSQKLTYKDQQNNATLTSDLEYLIDNQDFNNIIDSLFNDNTVLFTQEKFDEIIFAKQIYLNTLQTLLFNFTSIVNSKIPELKQFWKTTIQNQSLYQNLDEYTQLEKFYAGYKSELDYFGYIYNDILHQEKSQMIPGKILENYFVTGSLQQDPDFSKNQEIVQRIKDFIILQELTKVKDNYVVQDIFPMFMVQECIYKLPDKFVPKPESIYVALQPDIHLLKDLDYIYHPSGNCILQNQNCDGCKFRGIEHYNFISGRYNQWLGNWEKFFGKIFSQQPTNNYLSTSEEIYSLIPPNSIVVSDFRTLATLQNFNYKGDNNLLFTQLLLTLIRTDKINNKKVVSTYIKNINVVQSKTKTILEYLTQIVENYAKIDESDIQLQNFLKILSGTFFDTNSTVQLYDKFSFSEYKFTGKDQIFRISDESGTGITPIIGVNNVFVTEKITENVDFVNVNFESNLTLEQVCQILYLNFGRISGLELEGELEFVKNGSFVRVNGIAVSSTSLSQFSSANFTNGKFQMVVQSKQLQEFISYLMTVQLVKQTTFQTVQRLFPGSMNRKCSNLRLVLVSDREFPYLASNDKLFVQKTAEYGLDICDQIMRFEGDNEFKKVNTTYIKPINFEKIEKKEMDHKEFIIKILSHYQDKHPNHEVISNLLQAIKTQEVKNLIDFYPKLAITEELWNKIPHTDEDFIIRISK